MVSQGSEVRGVVAAASGGAEAVAGGHEGVGSGQVLTKIHPGDCTAVAGARASGCARELAKSDSALTHAFSPLGFRSGTIYKNMYVYTYTHIWIYIDI
jgi:hypothetical protein